MMKSIAAVQTECDCTAPEKDIVPISCGFKESAKSPKSPELPQQVVIQNRIFKMLGPNPLTANQQLMGVMSLSGAVVMFLLTGQSRMKLNAFALD